MHKQERLINNSDWDTLIVLDACRYDYFKEVYNDYFDGCNGELTKVISPSTNTIDWLRTVFSGKYKDTVYISANPYINSKKTVSDFNAREKFKYIVDVWDKGWDDDLRTVPPKEVNRFFLDNYEKNSKHIVHYMQPHAPYLSHPVSYNKQTIADSGKWGGFIKSTAKKLLGDKRAKRLGRFLGFHPKKLVRQTVEEVGAEKTKSLYKENLQFVLKAVRNVLLSNIGKKTIITADHGELLGENGRFGHEVSDRPKELIEVPWYELKMVK